MAIEIRELSGEKARLRDFLDVVSTIYAGDPNYVRSLDMDVGDRLNVKKNPFFEHGEGTQWVAYKNGTAVGRISAQIDHEHQRIYGDKAGFFGFLDTVEDPEVASQLLAEAARWNKAHGMLSMRGPFNLSINEELGCLIDGFDMPPMIMMPHHLPYQSKLIEGAGYAKLKDFYAWTYDIGEVPARAQKAHDEIAVLPEVTTRLVDPKQVSGDLGIIMRIFNDAWSENWGFVPLTAKELAKMAEDMKLILMPEITRIVSIDGEPAAVALGMPNLNEFIDDFDGKLSPMNVAKLLYRLKLKGPESGRLIILGINRKWRNIRKYAGLSAYLYVQMNRASHLLGMKRGELSWTLEDNAPINAGIRLMGGRIYKTYRVFEKSLS